MLTEKILINFNKSLSNSNSINSDSLINNKLINRSDHLFYQKLDEANLKERYKTVLSQFQDIAICEDKVRNLDKKDKPIFVTQMKKALKVVIYI